MQAIAIWPSLSCKYDAKDHWILYKPTIVLGAWICEVDDAIFIKIKAIEELELHTIKLLHNWLSESTIRSNFHQPKVTICNEKLSCLLIESQTQRTTADVLILWLFYWWVAVVANLRPEDFFTPRTWCTNKGPGSNMKLQNLLREKTFNSSSSSSFFFFIMER